LLGIYHSRILNCLQGAMEFVQGCCQCLSVLQFVIWLAVSYMEWKTHMPDLQHEFVLLMLDNSCLHRTSNFKLVTIQINPSTIVVDCKRYSGEQVRASRCNTQKLLQPCMHSPNVPNANITILENRLVFDFLVQGKLRCTTLYTLDYCSSALHSSSAIPSGV